MPFEFVDGAIGDRDDALTGVGVDRVAGEVLPGAIEIPTTRQLAIATAASTRRRPRRSRHRGGSRRVPKG
jgi:hypothetical protein